MAKIYKPLLLILLAACCCTDLKAQDPHFSQFYAAPWKLNPALNGVFNGRARVTMNYREQWNSFLAGEAFRTYGAGADLRYEVGRNDYFSGGISILRDEAGEGRFSQTLGHLSGSYIKKLADGGRNGADHYASLGAQIGMGQNSLDWGNLWFSRQFDQVNEVPDFGAANGEANMNGSSGTYMDFNAGALWYALYGEEGFIYAGAAMHHLNTPTISLMGDDSETLYSRFSAHAGGLVPLTENLGLAPAVLVMSQGPSFQTMAGANIRYTNHDRNELGLRFGGFARMSNRLDDNMHLDAIAVVAMVEYNRWNFGVSYDINTSSLQNVSNARGGVELSMQYYHLGTRRTKVKCPKL